jgi:hypothetical protein
MHRIESMTIRRRRSRQRRRRRRKPRLVRHRRRL